MHTHKSCHFRRCSFFVLCIMLTHKKYLQKSVTIIGNEFYFSQELWKKAGFLFSFAGKWDGRLTLFKCKAHFQELKCKKRRRIWYDMVIVNTSFIHINTISFTMAIFPDEIKISLAKKVSRARKRKMPTFAKGIFDVDFLFPLPLPSPRFKWTLTGWDYYSFPFFSTFIFLFNFISRRILFFLIPTLTGSPWSLHDLISLFLMPKNVKDNISHHSEWGRKERQRDKTNWCALVVSFCPLLFYRISFNSAMTSVNPFWSIELIK